MVNQCKGQTFRGTLSLSSLAVENCYKYQYLPCHKFRSAPDYNLWKSVQSCLLFDLFPKATMYYPAAGRNALRGACLARLEHIYPVSIGCRYSSLSLTDW